MQTAMKISAVAACIAALVYSACAGLGPPSGASSATTIAQPTNSVANPSPCAPTVGAVAAANTNEITITIVPALTNAACGAPKGVQILASINNVNNFNVIGTNLYSGAATTTTFNFTNTLWSTTYFIEAEEFN
jgi:hypothetical protein